MVGLGNWFDWHMLLSIVVVELLDLYLGSS